MSENLKYWPENFSWQGDVDSEEGIATFDYFPAKVSLVCPNFKIAFAINSIIHKAYEQGANDKLREIRNIVERVE